MQSQPSNEETRLAEQGFPLTAKYHYGILGLAKRLANKYQQPNSEKDFQQVALLTACQYEKRFDPSNGAGFYAFASSPIKTAIQNEFGNPNAGSKIYKRLVKAISEYQDEHGTYPTMDDLVIATKLSRFKIMEVYFDRTREVPIDSILGEPEYNQEWVIDHLSILTDDEQRVVDLVFYQGHSIQDASIILKASIKLVNRTLEFALTKLRQSIKGG